MPTLIGAAMIAAAILLSTLINALGSRYVGFESPTEESAWLLDRLTGPVYKCQAAVARPRLLRGRIGDRQRQRPAKALKGLARGQPSLSGPRPPANPATLPRDAPRDHIPSPDQAEARRSGCAPSGSTAQPFGDGPQAIAAAVEHLGYVQIDTINVIERCHHHIL